MKNFFQKILGNPLLSLAFWIILLLTKMLITDSIWGTLCDLGGAAIFICSLVIWSQRNKI
jgi:hypothetical protein